MMSDFASKLMIKVAESLREDLGSDVCQSFILLFLFLFCFPFLELLYFQFDHLECIEDSIAIGSVLVDVAE